VKQFLLFLIRFYQKHLAFKACRFQPTCSEYTYQAISRHGIIRGSWLGVKRVIRCHPWSKGGSDPLKRSNYVA